MVVQVIPSHNYRMIHLHNIFHTTHTLQHVNAAVKLSLVSVDLEPHTEFFPLCTPRPLGYHKHLYMSVNMYFMCEVYI